MAIVSASWLDAETLVFPFNYQLVSLFPRSCGVRPLLFSPGIKIAPLEVPKRSGGLSLGQRMQAYFKPVFSHKPFIVYLAATFLYRIALNLPVPLFTLLWVNELLAPDTLIGLRGTIGYSALVVGYLLWGRIANQLGHRTILYISTLGLAVYVLVSGILPSAIWILPAALLWGMGAAGVDVGLFDMMLEPAPASGSRCRRLLSMEANLCVFIGPLIGAALSGYLVYAGNPDRRFADTHHLPFLWLPRD